MTQIQVHNVQGRLSKYESKDLPSDLKGAWVKPTWDNMSVAIDNADAVDIANRNVYSCDDWAEHKLKDLPSDNITIHIGDNMVCLEKSYGSNWRMRIVERSDYEEGSHAAGGTYKKVVCLFEEIIKSRKGKRDFEKKLANFMIKVGRPWIDFAYYRQP